MLMEILCKTEDDSLSSSVQIILPPMIIPDFFRMHHMLQKALLRHEFLTW